METIMHTSEKLHNAKNLLVHTWGRDIEREIKIDKKETNKREKQDRRTQF